MQVDCSVDWGVAWLTGKLLLSSAAFDWSLTPQYQFCGSISFYLDPDIAEMLRETKIKNLISKTIFFCYL